MFDVNDRIRISAKFAEMRSKSGFTQKQMADAIGVSLKTVQTWERGNGQASFITFLNWFTILGLNYEYYSNILQYSDCYWMDDREKSDSEIRKELNRMIADFPFLEVHQLHYIMFAKHGSEPFRLIEVICAYLHTSMHSRASVARQLVALYTMQRDSGTLVLSDSANVDTNLLKKCVNQGIESASKGKYGYAPMLYADRDWEAIYSILQRCRLDSEISQIDYATHFGVSTKTIGNWESGKTRPYLLDFVEWFRLGNSSINHYLNPLIYRAHYKHSEGVESERADIYDKINSMSSDKLRKLHYIFLGDHGSSPYAILELFNAYCHTTMMSRVSQTHAILNNYQIDMQSGRLIKPGIHDIDINAINGGIEAGTSAASQGENSYT